MNSPFVRCKCIKDGKSNVFERIHEVASEYVAKTSRVTNTDVLVAGIVYKLTGEGISRGEIDRYFKSEQSALRGRFFPHVQKNGW